MRTLRRQKYNISKMLLMIFTVVAPLFSVQAFDYGEDSKLTVPERSLSIIVGKEGFYPQNLSVFEGEKLKVFITSISDEPSCFTLPEKNLFLSALKGKISEGVLYFDRQGIYKFHCPAGNIQGSITVLKKKVLKDGNERSVASEKVKLAPMVWRPKED